MLAVYFTRNVFPIFLLKLENKAKGKDQHFSIPFLLRHHHRRLRRSCCCHIFSTSSYILCLYLPMPMPMLCICLWMRTYVYRRTTREFVWYAYMKRAKSGRYFRDESCCWCFHCWCCDDVKTYIERASKSTNICIRYIRSRIMRKKRKKQSERNTEEGIELLNGFADERV